MLILLRSDFRKPTAKEAFMKLMRNAHFKTEDVFEVPIIEAPGANAIILRLRRMQSKRDSALAIGTAKDESLEDSLRVLNGVRNSIPYLAIFPHILIARRTEWRTYGQVMHADRAIECFEVSESKVLVIEQRDSYTELTHRMVLAFMIPQTIATNEGKVRDGEQVTTEFRLGDAPSATHERITDQMLAEAGIQGSIEPEPQDRITEIPPPPDVPFDAKKHR